MEYFSYKGVCGVCGHAHIEALKEELAWAIDKSVALGNQVISNIMLFITVI